MSNKIARTVRLYGNGLVFSFELVDDDGQSVGTVLDRQQLRHLRQAIYDALLIPPGKKCRLIVAKFGPVVEERSVKPREVTQS